MRQLEEKYLCIHYINIRQTSGFWCFLLGELCGEVNDGGEKGGWYHIFLQTNMWRSGHSWKAYSFAYEYTQYCTCVKDNICVYKYINASVCFCYQLKFANGLVTYFMCNAILHLTTNTALRICTAHGTSQGRPYWVSVHVCSSNYGLVDKKYLLTMERGLLATLREDSILPEIWFCLKVYVPLKNVIKKKKCHELFHLRFEWVNQNTWMIYFCM